VAIVPFFAPSTMPASIIAKVCKVRGIPSGMGIWIWAHTDIIATNKAMWHRSRIGSFFGVGVLVLFITVDCTVGNAYCQPLNLDRVTIEVSVWLRMS
jgi:hypothetical protein